MKKRPWQIFAMGRDRRTRYHPISAMDIPLPSLTHNAGTRRRLLKSVQRRGSEANFPLALQEAFSPWLPSLLLRGE